MPPPPPLRWVAGTTFGKGAFKLAGAKPPVLNVSAGAIEWVTGWFNETLPRFLAVTPQNVSLVHGAANTKNMGERTAKS